MVENTHRFDGMHCSTRSAITGAAPSLITVLISARHVGDMASGDIPRASLMSPVLSAPRLRSFSYHPFVPNNRFFLRLCWTVPDMLVIRNLNKKSTYNDEWQGCIGGASACVSSCVANRQQAGGHGHHPQIALVFLNSLWAAVRGIPLGSQALGEE